MNCPYCYNDTKVTDFRPKEENTEIHRMRECLVCKQRFKTIETVKGKLT